LRRLRRRVEGMTRLPGTGASLSANNVVMKSVF